LEKVDNRPSAKQLQTHPFIKKKDDGDVTIRSDNEVDLFLKIMGNDWDNYLKSLILENDFKNQNYHISEDSGKFKNNQWNMDDLSDSSDEILSDTELSSYTNSMSNMENLEDSYDEIIDDKYFIFSDTASEKLERGKEKDLYQKRSSSFPLLKVKDFKLEEELSTLTNQNLNAFASMGSRSSN